MGLTKKEFEARNAIRKHKRTQVSKLKKKRHNIEVAYYRESENVKRRRRIENMKAQNKRSREESLRHLGIKSS